MASVAYMPQLCNFNCFNRNGLLGRDRWLLVYSEGQNPHGEMCSCLMVYRKRTDLRSLGTFNCDRNLRYGRPPNGKLFPGASGQSVGGIRPSTRRKS